MSLPGAGRRARYYGSREPHGDPHAQPTDGLDAVLFNGQEIGHDRRVRARKALAQQKAREQAWAFFGGED